MRRQLSCVGVVVLGFLGACSNSKGDGSGTDAPPPVPSRPAVLGERTTLATRAQVDAVAVTDGSLSFPAAGNESLMNMKMGDVLVGDRSSSNAKNRYGFLRMVTAVSKSGDQIVLTTTPAALDDALSDLRTQVSFATADLSGVPAGPGSTTKFFGEPGLVPLSTVSATLGGDFASSLSLPALNFTFTVPTEPPRSGEINFAPKFKEAKFQFTPTIDLGIDLHRDHWYTVIPSVREFHFISSGQVDAGLVIELDADMKIAQEVGNGDKLKANKDLAAKVQGVLQKLADSQKSKLSQPIPGVHFEMVGPPLGPVPTTITFDMDIVCTLGVKGGITVEFGGEASSKLTAGVKYDGSNWEKVTDFNFDSHVVGPTWTKAQGGISAQCGLKPKIGLMLADLVGPYTFLEADLNGDAAYTETCKAPDPTPAPDINLQATLELKGGGGGKVAVLGHEFFHYELSLFDFKTAPLVNLDFPLSKTFAIGTCEGEMAGAGGSGGAEAAGGSGGAEAAGGAGGETGTPGAGGAGGAGGETGTPGAGGAGGAGGETGTPGAGGAGGQAGAASGTCGDGKIDPGEQCDGADLGGGTCQSVASNPNPKGPLKCNADCTYNTSGCSGANCSHDECTNSPIPLDPSCNACANTVCNSGSSTLTDCCNIAWDAVCISAANSMCGKMCP